MKNLFSSIGKGFKPSADAASSSAAGSQKVNVVSSNSPDATPPERRGSSFKNLLSGGASKSNLAVPTPASATSSSPAHSAPRLPAQGVQQQKTLTDEECGIVANAASQFAAGVQKIVAR